MPHQAFRPCSDNYFDRALPDVQLAKCGHVALPAHAVGSRQPHKNQDFHASHPARHTRAPAHQSPCIDHRQRCGGAGAGRYRWAGRVSDAAAQRKTRQRQLAGIARSARVWRPGRRQARPAVHHGRCRHRRAGQYPHRSGRAGHCHAAGDRAGQTAGIGCHAESAVQGRPAGEGR